MSSIGLPISSSFKSSKNINMKISSTEITAGKKGKMSPHCLMFEVIFHNDSLACRVSIVSFLPLVSQMLQCHHNEEQNLEFQLESNN